jgi:acetolactate synthase regulatory subunit
MPTITTNVRLSLTTRADSDVLVRVLVLLRRRGCTVVTVNFRCPDRHRPGCFEVSVDAPTRIGHRLEEWLRGLVDVVEVGPGPDGSNPSGGGMRRYWSNPRPPTRGAACERKF